MHLGFAEDDGLVYSGSELVVPARLPESWAPLQPSWPEAVPADGVHPDSVHPRMPNNTSLGVG